LKRTDFIKKSLKLYFPIQFYKRADNRMSLLSFKATLWHFLIFICHEV